jgi:hypothetical protein
MARALNQQASQARPAPWQPAARLLCSAHVWPRPYAAVVNTLVRSMTLPALCKKNLWRKLLTQAGPV